MTLFVVATNAPGYSEEAMALTVARDYANDSEMPSNIRICYSLFAAQEALAALLSEKKAAAAAGEAEQTEWGAKVAMWEPGIFQVQISAKRLD
jgi:hypothetical protein